MNSGTTRTSRMPAFWDTPRRPMITHTSDSHQIPSQKKTKSKLWILKNYQNFLILQETLHATHLLRLLDKMCKYEMDPTRTVGTTERTPDTGRTDRRTDGVKPIYPPYNLVVRGYNDTCIYICCLSHTANIMPADDRAFIRSQGPDSI